MQLELNLKSTNKNTMNIEKSYKALEIIKAHLNGETISLRYRGVTRWYPLENTEHTDWNFAKYDYRIENVKPSSEEYMKSVYKSELGSTFQTVDSGVAVGIQK